MVGLHNLKTIPQNFSGVTKLKLIMPINSLRIFWLRVFNLNPWKLFGVISSVMIPEKENSEV